MSTYELKSLRLSFFVLLLQKYVLINVCYKTHLKFASKFRTFVVLNGIRKGSMCFHWEILLQKQIKSMEVRSWVWGILILIFNQVLAVYTFDKRYNIMTLQFFFFKKIKVKDSWGLQKQFGTKPACRRCSLGFQH